MPNLLANFKNYDFRKHAVRDKFHSADNDLARIMLKKSVGLDHLVYFNNEKNLYFSLINETEDIKKVKVLLEFMTPDAYLKAINPYNNLHVLSETKNERKAELIIKQRKLQSYPVSFIINDNSLIDNAISTKICNLLAQYGENIHRVDSNNRTIFEKTSDPKKVLWLLNKGADPNHLTSTGVPLLKHYENNKDLFFTVLNSSSRIPVNLNNHDVNEQPLLALIQNKDMLAALIQKGADVNKINNRKIPPLLFIEDEKLCELLLLKGASLSFQDIHAQNLLLMDYKNISIEKFNFLMSNNVNVEKKDFKGKALIHYLVQSGIPNQEEKITAYCKAGKDLNLKDNNGDNMIIYINDYHLLKKLYPYGLNIRNLDNEGEFTLIKKLTADYPVEILSPMKNLLKKENDNVLLNRIYTEMRNLHVSYSVLSIINKTSSPLLKSINELDLSKLITKEKELITVKKLKL